MGAMTGGCACGRVRYAAEFEDEAAYLCHCRMCLRSTGSVSTNRAQIAEAPGRKHLQGAA